MTSKTRTALPWLLLAAAAVWCVVRGILAYASGLPSGGDTAVYQGGAATLLHGLPLYDADFLDDEPDFAKLPFTYAPFAAVLFIPMVLVPSQVAWGVLNAISLVAVALVGWLVLRRVETRPRWLTPSWGGVAAALLMTLTQPLSVTLEYGQINAVLMLFVVVDVLVVCGSAGRARHGGGVLVGVAAATKLTPLIFVVHLLLVGRRADAARAAGTFAGLQGLMLLIAPHDTVRFWTHTVFDSSRIGPTGWAWNQSVGGLLRRLNDGAGWSQPVAYGIGALLAAGAIVLVLRYHRAGQPVPALLVSAFLALLVSPVSWIHHWVWAVPLVLVLLARRKIVAAVVTVLVFALRPVDAPGPGEHPGLWETGYTFVLGNAYVLFAIAFGVVLLARGSAGRLYPVGSSRPEAEHV